jgi:hypothetical protein
MSDTVKAVSAANNHIGKHANIDPCIRNALPSLGRGVKTLNEGKRKMVALIEALIDVDVLPERRVSCMLIIETAQHDGAWSEFNWIL